jgi:hypothetical protein
MPSAFQHSDEKAFTRLASGAMSSPLTHIRQKHRVIELTLAERHTWPHAYRLKFHGVDLIAPHPAGPVQNGFANGEPEQAQKRSETEDEPKGGDLVDWQLAHRFVQFI